MKKRRFRICLALAAAAGTLSLAGCGGDTAMADVLSAGMEQETCDISGDYSKIDIQAELAEVTIQPGRTASMEVCLEQGYTMERTVKDDTLYLTEQERETFWRKIFHLNSADNAVRITLPEHMVEEIAVSSDISDVHISGQKIRRISVNANNGNVELSACEGEDVQVRNKNGNVNLKGLAASLRAELKNGDLKIQDSSGDSLYASNKNGRIGTSGAAYTEFYAEASNGAMELKDVTSDAIQLSNTNGRVQLELNGKQADFDYDINNHNGKVMIGGSTVGTFHTDFSFSNDTGRTLTADLKNGDLTVTFLEQADR